MPNSMVVSLKIYVCPSSSSYDVHILDPHTPEFVLSLCLYFVGAILTDQRFLSKWWNAHQASPAWPVAKYLGVVDDHTLYTGKPS